jgi:hypothetical protein
MNLSPNGELGVSGEANGVVRFVFCRFFFSLLFVFFLICSMWNRVWKTSTGEDVSEWKGHIGDVTSVRFFPSNEVVLTGAQDACLKVWTLQGQLAATLKGRYSSPSLFLVFLVVW